MDIIEAIILGIIQGATEFLPISSSGHLVVVPALFNLSEPDLNVIAIAHLGSLVAVFVYFWKDIVAIIRGVIGGILAGKPFGNEDARLGWLIVLGSVPAGVLGLSLEAQFDAVFGNPNWAAVFLLGTAGLLVLGERMLSGKKQIKDMGPLDAIIIGLAQMMALLPGISRSGSTMVGGLGRGLNRELSARFSFLLGIPAILGAGTFAIVDLVQEPDLAAQLPALAATFITAGLVGYLCIFFLLRWLRERSLYPFAIYCVCMSLLYFVVQAVR